MKTLILIDIQNDFMPGGALAVPRGDKILPVVNGLLHKFDLIVATQDWHPQEHLSFASNHENRNPFETIYLRGLEQTLWPDHCIQGTGGAEFHPGLEQRGIEAIFRKGMDPEIDSYSGFFDNGHKKATGLYGYLKEKGAGDIYVCGLAGDICVYYTLVDAISRGFRVNYIDDASMPLNAEGFESIKEDMLKKGANVLNSEEI